MRKPIEKQRERWPIDGCLRTLVICAVLSAATLLAFHGYGRPLTGVDDANIFLTYGKNIAQGHGLVYNVGGERVEGFSSLLWVYVIAATLRITSRPEILLVATSIVALALALAAAASLLEDSARTREGRPILAWSSLLFLGWVLCAPGFLSWAVLSLMATGLWCALLVGTAAVLVAEARAGQKKGSGWVLALLAALLVLTRPEGIVIAPWACIVFTLTSWLSTKSLRDAARRSLPAILSLLASAGGLLWFRLAYFGYPLPNTYYAKVSPDLAYRLREGLEYFAKFVMSNGTLQVHLIACIVGLSAVVGSLRRRKPLSPLAAISLFLLPGLLLPIWEGGDHFDEFRFYQPIWPLLFLPSFFLFERLRESLDLELLLGPGVGRRWLAAASVVLLFSLGNSTKWYPLADLRFGRQLDIAHSGREVGRLMNETFAGQPPPSVGVVTAGGIAYTYEGHVVDLLGLNNTEMAHAPGSRRGITGHASFHEGVFWRQRPELLLPTIVLGGQTPSYSEAWANLPLGGLLTSDTFESSYRPATFGDREPGSSPALAALATAEAIERLGGRSL